MNLIFKDIFLKLAPLFFGHAKEKRGPCLRVVFREVSDDFGGGLIVEASQSGSIIVVDECEDEGVSLVLGGEAVFPAFRRLAGLAAMASLRRRLKRSTMPLVWGW